MKVYRRTHPDSTKRRKAVIERLEAQLKLGIKHMEPKFLVDFHNPNDIGDGTLPLTDADKLRINKEITILKSRI